MFNSKSRLEFSDSERLPDCIENQTECIQTDPEISERDCEDETVTLSLKKPLTKGDAAKIIHVEDKNGSKIDLKDDEIHNNNRNESQVSENQIIVREQTALRRWM